MLLIFKKLLNQLKTGKNLFTSIVAFQPFSAKQKFNMNSFEEGYHSQVT